MRPEDNALPPRGTALLLALTAALLLLRLGAVPLVGPDEPRYARVAVEMRRSGDPVTPTLQGRPWLEKPPLYYWLAAMAYSFLGETETAARLPSVAACLLLVGATALFGARLSGTSAGLHTGFILATAVLPFAYGRAASMDMLLAATVTAAVGLFALRFLRIAGGLAIPCAWLFMALATLAKGPLGLVLPGLVMVGYLVAARERRLLREIVSPSGILIFLLVAAPWHLLIFWAQGQEFIDVYMLNHNLQRFTSTIHHHPGPFYYYVPVMLLGLFPWSGLAVPALTGLRARSSKADLFVLLWLLLPLVFFSAAGSKLPGYILPCLPPLAMLMGRAADRLVRRQVAGARWRAAALLGLALGSLVAAAPLLLRREGEPAWLLTLPAGLWALLITFSFSRTLARDRAGSLRLLRVGAAGLLLLLTSAAPRVLAHRESGRDLILPARGRQVLAWGAWRTAWMAGYFYNDGKVREVRDVGEVRGAAAAGPVLVLCGPAERRRLETLPALTTVTLAEGPRGNALLRVAAR